MSDDYATRAIHLGKNPKYSTSNISSIDEGQQVRDVLEKSLASLDDGKYGLCFATCVSTVSAILSLLKTGDHLICGDDIFGGTCCLIRQVFSRFKIEADFIDMGDTSNVENAIKANTKLIFYETPTNPTLKVTDINEVSKIAKSHNIITVVENTFLTSYFQKPLNLGADIVVNSLTKYINGHSDVFMGSIITNSTDLYHQLKMRQESMGLYPSTFDCTLINQSLKSLPLRMKEHMFNALKVAEFLETHSAVEKVLYTGLPSHPQFELSKRQTTGHCGIISFYIKGGLNEAHKFLNALKIFKHAASFGGFESLAQIPKCACAGLVPEDLRNQLGITDNFIRLSVGLEYFNDLIDDLDQALKAVQD